MAPLLKEDVLGKYLSEKIFRGRVKSVEEMIYNYRDQILDHLQNIE